MHLEYGCHSPRSAQPAVHVRRFVATKSVVLGIKVMAAAAAANPARAATAEVSSTSEGGGGTDVRPDIRPWSLADATVLRKGRHGQKRHNELDLDLLAIGER